MSPASIHGEPISPTGGGEYIISNPPSSTPTLDVSFDRAGLGDFSAQLNTPPPLWPLRLSASFSAMADQIAATSQALALVPSSAFGGADASTELGTLRGRLEGIERTQEQIMSEFETLKTQLMRGGTDRGNVQVNGNANGNENGITTVPSDGAGEGEGEGDGKPAILDPAAQAAKIEELEKKLNELSESFKIEQQRLPVRLHNSRATIMRGTLKTPIMANGKPAPGFPSSRGEFEHITKERYEALLKLYSQPLKGDTDAKREALRMFAGIPQDGQ